MHTVEVYVLCKERSKILAENFLDHFIPNRHPIASDYSFPELVDDPEIIYKKVGDLMTRLDIERTKGYSLYWNNTKGNIPRQGMLFYTKDGFLIAGVVVKEGYQREWINRLSNFFGAQFGYTSFEEAPPDSQYGFIRRCNNSVGMKLIDGKVLE